MKGINVASNIVYTVGGVYCIFNGGLITGCALIVLSVASGWYHLDESVDDARLADRWAMYALILSLIFHHEPLILQLVFTVGGVLALKDVGSFRGVAGLAAVMTVVMLHYADLGPMVLALVLFGVAVAVRTWTKHHWLWHFTSMLAAVAAFRALIAVFLAL